MNTRNRGGLLTALLLAFLAAIPAFAATGDAETARLIQDLGLHESAVALRDRPGWTAPKKVVLMGADAARVAWMQEAAPGIEVVGVHARNGGAAGRRPQGRAAAAGFATVTASRSGARPRGDDDVC